MISLNAQPVKFNEIYFYLGVVIISWSEFGIVFVDFILEGNIYSYRINRLY